ncbi:hypothetical protein K227x_63300 [Rubripirellula lacrimiformis]|uniref:Uncharacterized protein n=1 Tax=Rubripirellula lacrimiformis TaxID=1930273 RepID=A0A517NL99_9BACT|nr:hypothetical protein K227x_63300 [Rubripirellula lacrimiformis]
MGPVRAPSGGCIGSKRISPLAPGPPAFHFGVFFSSSAAIKASAMLSRVAAGMMERAKATSPEKLSQFAYQTPFT